MATIKIYGTSDDLVEVEGDVPGCDEYGCGERFIELSSGDVFQLEYAKHGVWTVSHVVRGGLKAMGGTYTKEPYGKGDDPEPYTETVRINAPIEWVEAWETYPVTADEMRRKVGLLLTGNDEFDRKRMLSDKDVCELWGIVARAKRRGK